MKFRITMKDPDGVDAGIDEVFDKIESEKLRELLNKWFKWNEYLTVEIDTETKTIVVVEN